MGVQRRQPLPQLSRVLLDAVFYRLGPVADLARSPRSRHGCGGSRRPARNGRRELRARRWTPDAETWNRALDAELRALVLAGRREQARERLLDRLGAA